jgi:hypothetical protein
LGSRGITQAVDDREFEVELAGKEMVERTSAARPALRTSAAS